MLKYSASVFIQKHC